MMVVVVDDSDDDDGDDGWSTASCFAYSKAAFWGKTECRSIHTDQWAGLKHSSGRKKPPKERLQTYGTASFRYIHFKISSSMGARLKFLFWPAFRHLVVNHEWVLLSIGWVALYSEKLIENKHSILTFIEHPLPTITDYWLMSFPSVIERAHLLFWPNDIWRMW